MNRLKTVLKDRSGQGTPMILAVVVCCLILACVVFEYMRLMIVAQGVRDSVQSAIVAVATENWDEAYPGLREGYSGGYQLSGSSWTKNVTTGNVYDRLQQVLGLVYEDGRYLKYAGPDLEYRFYDLHMELENAPLVPLRAGGDYAAQCDGNGHGGGAPFFRVRPFASHADHHEAERQICSPVLDFVYFCLTVFHSAKKCLCVLPPGRHCCANGIMRTEEHIDLLI